MSPTFEINKIKRLIRENGSSFTFIAKKMNEFGEPDDSLGSEVVVPGLYHESQGYVTTVGSDGGNIKTKPDSQILCLASSTKSLEIGMKVHIEGKDYKLIDIRNINNWGIACDLSLELILDGK